VHIQGIVHRDIKPANLLLSEDHITVKISDFGVSIYEIPTNRGKKETVASEVEFADLMEDSFLNRTAGTPSFLAPEVCPPSENGPTVQSSKFALDTWALGVTYYCLLFGHPPWESNEVWSLLHKISTDDFEIPEAMGSDELETGGRNPSEEFADGKGVLTILSGLLTKDPEKRLTLNCLKVSVSSRTFSARLSFVQRIPYLTKDIEDLPRWMQETAKQAGDVILVSEVETQSAIGSVRWRIRSSFAKLRLRPIKSKSGNANPRSVQFPSKRPLTPITFYKGLQLRSSKEKDSELASRQSNSTEQMG
jgi:SNF1-activating kinase 1